MAIPPLVDSNTEGSVAGRRVSIATGGRVNIRSRRQRDAVDSQQANSIRAQQWRVIAMSVYQRDDESSRLEIIVSTIA